MVTHAELEPEETEDRFYLRSECNTLGELITKAKTKWGSHIEIEDIRFEALHFHAYCIGHDSYCSGDYVDYIVVVKP